jgi:hypothetical protein
MRTDGVEKGTPRLQNKKTRALNPWQSKERESL